MTARLVAFRSADRSVTAASAARVARLEVEQRAEDEIESRRARLAELGHQVADELSLLDLDQLRARLDQITASDPAARGARSAAGDVGEGGGPPSAAPLPLVQSTPNPSS